MVQNNYLTVTALTKYIKRKLDIDPHLQGIWLKGEISNFNHHNRGHMYLTIKDDHSRIQAVMFRGNNRHLKFIPENGMNVLIKGHISLFEPYGNYQLYIKSMQPDGIGALYLAYEQLKEKLRRAGYFDAEHKKAIPKYPDHIAVITSPTGAAVKDIVTTIKRRYPITQITVIPVLVQGEEAAETIKTAIELACSMNTFDTLIVGRGGGSIEDLWSFNDERVAKAIFQSTVPVISAVGHETDMTISDFVADLRAATPTGAAEQAVPSLAELQSTITHLRARLQKVTQLSVMRKTEALQRLKQSRVFHLPKQLLYEKEQLIDRLTDTMWNRFTTISYDKKIQFEQQQAKLQANHPHEKITNAMEKTAYLTERLNKQMGQIVQKKQNKLDNLINKLTLLNPLHIMQRGFAIPLNNEKNIITSTDEVAIDDNLEVQMSDGSIFCKVQHIRRDTDE